jgi:hypothetical protein
MSGGPRRAHHGGETAEESGRGEADHHGGQRARLAQVWRRSQGWGRGPGCAAALVQRPGSVHGEDEQRDADAPLEPEGVADPLQQGQPD